MDSPVPCKIMRLPQEGAVAKESPFTSFVPDTSRGNGDPQRSPAGRQNFPDEDRNSTTPLNSCGTEAQVLLSSQKNRFLLSPQTLESPLDSKTKPVNPKRNQS